MKETAAQAGNLYFADSTDYRVRRIDVNGLIKTIAGTDEEGGITKTMLRKRYSFI